MTPASSGERSMRPAPIGEDNGVTADMVDAANATARRRIFMKCAADSIRKAEQGAGLRDARGSEIDREILQTLGQVIKTWSDLRAPRRPAIPAAAKAAGVNRRLAVAFAWRCAASSGVERSHACLAMGREASMRRGALPVCRANDPR